MSRARIAVAALLTVLAAALLSRGGGPSAVPRAVEERALPAPRAPAAATPDPGAPAPLRNVFQYVHARAPVWSATPAPSPLPLISLAPSLPPSPPSVRLVGLVRRDGGLKVALSIHGDLVILGTGEESAGYRVDSIEEGEVVRMVGPDGAAIVLALAPSR